MLSRFFNTTILVLVLTDSFSQSTLIGNWRRVDSNSTHTNTNQSKNKWGDIHFYKDSTFLIYGDSSTNISTTPGWHVGDELKGNWEISNTNHLTLWLEPKKERYFLVYTIIKLTKAELILRSHFDKSSDKNDIKYSRL